jgi:hypothetical protein
LFFSKKMDTFVNKNWTKIRNIINGNFWIWFLFFGVFFYSWGWCKCAQIFVCLFGRLCQFSSPIIITIYICLFVCCLLFSIQLLVIYTFLHFTANYNYKIFFKENTHTHTKNRKRVIGRKWICFIIRWSLPSYICN